MKQFPKLTKTLKVRDLSKRISRCLVHRRTIFHCHQRFSPARLHRRHGHVAHAGIHGASFGGDQDEERGTGRRMV